MDEVFENIMAIAKQFQIDGEPISVCSHGNGHINRTWLVTTATGHRYILQRISEAFDIPALMKNMEAITTHLAKKVEDPRETLRLIPTVTGESYYQEESGNYRVLDFVENSICLEMPENTEDFYNCAAAFGIFQQQLADFPAETLAESIPDFHNTIKRFRTLREIVEKDVLGRACEVQAEIDFALAREEECGCLHRMRLSGELPLRVTHNDTKLNNILFDKDTRKPLCVLDLDTVMPGLSLYDFGDAIRSGAGTAMEDEQDLSKMTIDLEMFRAFTRGFLESCQLTDEEVRQLPMGAKVMTMETGIRFLGDYIDGDHYFATHRPGHNKERCRTQLKLVAEMETHWDEMKEIVDEAAEEIYGHRVY